jgi:dolichyl-phosphate-mannose--protein O-mannosyl transferase
MVAARLPARAGIARWLRALGGLGLLVALSCGPWLWPVLAGVPITKLHWHQEIWLPSWS